MLLRTASSQRCRLSITHAAGTTARLHQRTRPAFLRCSEEVLDAVEHRRPLVALETAILTHGLPYPRSLQVCLRLEHLIRDQGAIPATVGLIDGQALVGLSQAELTRLAEPASSKQKVSRRDLAACLASRTLGGTTVSATMILSHLAGISVFATGGIGGVHRGAQSSMDISADLIELGRCPVTVVSAGIKSILDIGRSLEVLETQGVAVATLGSSAAFPAFYSPTSGFNSPLRFDTVQDCARAMQAARALRLESGMLLAVPIPEPHASRAAPLQAAVEQAIAESEASGIASSGKEVTPWLLGRVNELTQGRSVESNVALIENNVTVAAQLARTYSALLDPPAPSQPPISERPKEISDANKVRGTIAVIGCMALDITSVMPASALVKTTYAGTVKFSLGGVARNVAEAAHKLLPGANVALVAPVNANFASRYAIEAIEQLGMRRDALLPLQTSRGVGVANLLLDSQGLLQAGVVDMTSVEQVTAEEIKSKLNDVIDMSKRSIAIFDANLRPEVIASVLAYCHERGVATLFEPTSLDKASRICHTFQTQRQPRLSMMTPNAIELRRMYDTCRKVQLDQEDRWFASIDLLGIDSDFRAKLDRRMPRWMLDQGIPQQAIFMLAFVDTLLVKCGSQGFLVAHRLNGPQGAKEDKHSVINEHLMMQYFPAVPAEIVNDTGAGDSMAGAWAAAYVQNGFASADAVRKAALYAQRAAIASLQSESAVGDLTRVML